MALTDQELDRLLAVLPDKETQAWINGRLSDEQLEQLAVRAGVKAGKKAPAEEQAKPAPKRRALDTAGDAVSSGLRRTGSGMLQRGIDAEEIAKREEAQPWYQRDILDYVGFGPDERARADADIVSAVQGYEEGETYSDIQRRMESQAEASEQRVDKDVKSLDSSVGRTIARGGADALTSPLSYLSVFGGPVGALSGVDSYARTYREARKAGVSIEDAERIARETQVTESAIGMIPAAKLLGPLSKIGSKSSSYAVRAGSGIARNAAGEGLNEVATEAFNFGRSAERAAWDDDEKVRKYSEEQLPKSIADGADTLFRTFMAGAMGGGAMSAPTEMFAATKKVAEKAADEIAGDDAVDEDFEEEVINAPRRAPEPEQGNLFGELPTNPNFEAERQRELEMDAAFSVNRRQTAAEELRTRELLGVQSQLDAARQSMEGLQERVESGQASNADLTALGAATRRVRGLENMLGQLTAVQAEAPQVAPVAPTVDAPVQQGELAVTTKQPNELRLEAARAEARKRLEKDKKDIQKAATTKRNAALKQHTTSLMNQARDMSPEQAEQFVAENLLQWEDANPIESYVQKQRETLVMKDTNRNQRRVAQSNRAAGRGPKPTPIATTEELLAALGPDATTGSEAPVTGGGRIKKMILSGGTGADRALQENRAWPSIDGSTKYEIPDNESSVNLPDEVDSREFYRAGDVLQHDRLYEELPELADVPVRIINDPDSPYGGGYSRPSDLFPMGVIEINVGQDQGDPSAFNSTTHQSLIHEMQHAAQNLSKTTGGASVVTFLTPRGREVGNTLQALSSGIQDGKELGADVSDLEAEYDALLPEWQEEFDNAAIQYMKVLGEQEAYSSQDRLALTDEQRQADTLTREQNIINDQGVSYDSQGNTIARADQVAMRPGQVASNFLDNVRDAKTMLLKFAQSAEIPAYRELATLLSTSRWVGDVTVTEVRGTTSLPAELKDVFDSGAVGLAYFNADDGKPSLFFDSTREGGVREEAVVHEAVHALTEAALTRNPKLRHDLEKLAANIRATMVRLGMNDAVEYWDNGIKNDAGELLAYGLTSPRFRSIFNKLDENGNVPGEKNPSLFDKFVDFVFNALSIPPRFRPRFNSSVKSLNAGPTRKLTKRLDETLKTLLADTEQKGTSIHGTIKAFRIEQLKAGRERMLKPNNKVLTHLRNAFSGFGPLGRQLAAMKEMADGFAALRSHNAMNHFHEINRGITQAAKLEVAAGKFKDQEAAEKSVRANVERAMRVMEAEDDAGRRVSIMNALVRRYPSLEGFPKAVNEVNELTRTLVRQMLEQNPNPTEAERALMQKMMNNTFRYTTRMYAAFQGAEGKAYSKRVQKEYEKARALVRNGKEIPPKYVDSYKKWSNAVNYLISNDLTIPPEGEIDGTSTDRLTRLYDTWIGDAARLKSNAKSEALARGAKKKEADQAARDAMIAGLLDRAPTISKEEMQGMADNLVLGMMGLADAGGPFAQYYRGFKEDRGILNKREALPEEIRTLFGEITDPATRLAITIAKQGELAGRTRLLLDMRELGEGKWLVKSADRGKPGNERFTQQLTGEGYGPLNGYYVDPNIAAAISDSLEMFSTMGDALAQGYQNSNALAQAMVRKGADGLAHLAGVQKLMTVVFDLYNMGMNAFGSPIMLMANGIYNPLQWRGGAQVAAQVIWDTGMQGGVELSQQTQDAIRYGVLDSARVQEIRRTPQQFVRSLISSRPEAVNTVLSGLGRAKRTGIEAFAMADAWVKIVSFQERTETLRKFYDAEGIKKTEHQLKEEAADQIKDTNITYSRTGAVIRGAERLGATTFMPYFVSVPRAVAYNLILASKDMVRASNAKTPAGKMALGMSAIRRMSGTAVATGGMVIAMKALAAAVNDEDEEKLAAMQKLMFPDARFADSLYLGKDEAGIPMFARFSRIDPFGPVNDFARILFDEHTAPQDKNRQVVEMLRDMLITNRVLVTGGKLAADVFADADFDIKDKNVKLERMLPKTANFFKDKLEAIPGLDGDDAESIITFIDSFTPGITDMFDPNNKGIKEESEEGARLLGNIITYTGGRMDRADPKLAAYAAGKELEDIRKFGRKRQSEGLKAGEDIDTLQERFLEDAQDEYDALRDVADVWDGLRNGLDMTPRQAASIMKNDARLKAPDIRNLHYGQWSIEAEQWIAKYSRIISTDSQVKAVKGFEDDRKLTPEEKQKIRKYLANMKALGYKVQE